MKIYTRSELCSEPFINQLFRKGGRVTPARFATVQNGPKTGVSICGNNRKYI
jgi:hypothetical protein